MKNLKTTGLVVGLAMVAIMVQGRLHADGPTISGYIDTTYTYNFSKPQNNTTTLRVYDAQHNNIELSLAHVAITGSMGDVGYVIETDYGADAASNTSGGSGAGDDFDIQEAYMTYTCPKTGAMLKVGKFVTPTGIEVIEAKDNPTITRGYLFSVEPFTHVGAMVTKTFGKVELGGGVVNGWDVTADNNEGKTVLGKVGFNFGDPLAFTISGYHGPEQTNTYDVTFPTNNVTLDGNNRSMIDITGVTNIIPKIALWFQAQYGQEDAVFDQDGDGIADDLGHWRGATLQPVVSITDKFSVGARVEYLDDVNGVKTGGGVNTAIRNFTLAPAYKMTDNLTFRAEYRSDSSNHKLWVDDKGVAKDSASTGTLQFVLTF